MELDTAAPSMSEESEDSEEVELEAVCARLLASADEIVAPLVAVLSCEPEPLSEKESSELNSSSRTFCEFGSISAEKQSSGKSQRRRGQDSNASESQAILLSFRMSIIYTLTPEFTR